MIQKMPEGVDSKFRLVLLVARRAEQLMRGARPKLDTDRPLKPARLAAREFEENRIRWDYGEEGSVLEPAGEAGAEPEADGAEVPEEETAVSK
jgi:DNA-directed RNA polymerase omega subunit